MLNNIKMGPKLIGSFLVVALIAAGVGVTGLFTARSMSEHLDEVGNVRMPSVRTLLEMSEAKQAIWVGERGLINQRMMDPKIRQAQYDWIESAWKRADAAWAEYEPLPQTAEESIVWRDFVPLWETWKKDHRRIWDLSKDKDRLMAGGKSAEDPEVTVLDTTIFEASLTARQSALKNQEKLDRLVQINREVASEAMALAAADSRRATTFLIALTAVGALLAIGLGIAIARSITGPLARGVQMTQELAKGHLGLRLRMDRKDEIGELAGEMDRFADDLQNKVVGSMQKIAAGDLSVEVRAADGQDEIAPALQKTVEALRGLVAESEMLTRAAVEGRLDTRGDASRFHGGYRQIVQGVNECLDAVIRPVQEAADVLERVADKDMTARVTGNYQGDHAKIKDSLNRAVENLDSALSQVAVAVDQVTAASNEIGTGSQALAQGASEQASSVEEVSSGLQELVSMTKQSAANAHEAKSLTDGARGSATQGLQSMERLSAAMEKIKASSDSTAKIVKTIDEIAFQTNLLALNAAVEAARAGDAGKGFAVVAEEVRNLAMRSAEAAKNTANLIEESVRNAESGVDLNQGVFGKLQEIAEQSNKVGEVMHEIATASEQQSSGIDQINSAMEQINQVTQQNAANSEESASAAEELSGQGEELRGLIGTFKVTHTAAVAGRPGAKKPTGLHVVPGGRSQAAVGGSAKRVQPARAVKPTPSAARPDPATLIPFDEDEDRRVMGEF